MFSIRPRRAFHWRAALAAFGLLLSFATAAQAAALLTTADRRAVEQTIRQQFDAFAHDDGERAFGLATRDIQRMFGSSDRFLDMVRDHYEAVYRPSKVQFGRIERVDAQWVQRVMITDGGGRVWRASFTVRRQSDKSWKIGGCTLEETDTVAI